MKILLTAFAAFDNRDTNVTTLILNELSNNIKGYDIEKLYLPVALNSSFNIVKEHINKHNPDMIILCGEAAKRSKISIEIKARNIVSKKLCEDDEVDLNNQIIVENGDDIIYSSFPTVEALSQVISKNIPVELSTDAGGYICNALYYQVQNEFKNIPCVFIHFPLPTGELSLSKMVEGLSTIIESL